MVEVVKSIGILVAGVIHLLPLSGVLGPTRLEALYGISFTEPNLRILMQHRAVLFGLLGAFLLLSLLRPAWQLPAVVMGLLSAAAFIGVAWQVGEYNALLRRVVLADVVAIAALVVALAGLLLPAQR
jgi:hypothetical protein